MEKKELTLKEIPENLTVKHEKLKSKFLEDKFAT